MPSLELIDSERGLVKVKRNKRGGVRLKVVIDFSLDGSYCEKCWVNKNMEGEDCLYMCKEFERVTGTRKFWFEKDEI